MKKLNMKALERMNRLMPEGNPRYVRCYDNGGASADCYTIVFTGNYRTRVSKCEYLSCSENPFHPQGVGQHGESDRPIDTPTYSHLGKKVKFETLPPEVKRAVMQDYIEMWEITPEKLIVSKERTYGSVTSRAGFNKGK